MKTEAETNETECAECIVPLIKLSLPGTEPADVASVDVEPPAATTVDLQVPLLDRLDELAAKQDEIRAMLIELQRPPTST